MGRDLGKKQNLLRHAGLDDEGGGWAGKDFFCDKNDRAEAFFEEKNNRDKPFFGYKNEEARTFLYDFAFKRFSLLVLFLH